jgi:hypothetical protein
MSPLDYVLDKLREESPEGKNLLLDYGVLSLRM